MRSGARPDQVPRWGAASTMVQPPEGAAAAGFATEERPPAQWINWLWNRTGAWLDFFRGPNVEQWVRVTTGTEIDSDSHRQFAIDTAHPESTDAYRYAFVAQDSGTTKMRVSKTGAEWVTRTNMPGSGAVAITALGITATTWLLGDDSGNLYLGSLDDGTGVGPVGANGNAWTIATGTVTGVVRQFASNGSRVFALSSSSGVYSDDDGATWTTYTISGTARSGDGWSCVFDGSHYVFCTQSGQAYASSDGASFAFKSSFSGTSAIWQLAVGEPGEVIAYRYNAASVSMFRSLDGGASWSTITPSSTLKPVKITSLRYASGQWLATSDVAPYLWSSNDLEAWHPLRVPLAESDTTAVGALAYDGSAWVAVGRSFALVCGRAMDPGDATYDHEDGSITYADAAYLRGRLVGDTAPADGDVLTWSEELEQWLPAAGGGGTITASQISDSTVDGRAVLTGTASEGRTALGLGGAAVLDVGTSSSTVAAGDDSRITGAAQKSANLSDLASASTARTNLGAVSTSDARLSDARTPTAHKSSHATGGSDALSAADVGAVPTTRTLAGLDLSADRTAAEVLAGLYPRTDYDFSSSTGWTLENGSVSGGSATITGGVARLAIGSSGNCAFLVGDTSAPRIRRALPSLRDPWRFRVEARLASVGAGGTGSNIWYLTLGLRNTTGTVRGVNFRVGFDGRPDGVTHNGATQVGTGAGGEITTAGGDAYVAVEVDRTILRLLYGYGTGGGAARPTVWTQQYVTSTLYTTFGVSQGGSASAPLPWSEVFIALERTVSSVGASATVDFDDLRVIDLGQ